MTYNEFKKIYAWTIKNYPNITSLYGIDEQIITVTETHYTKHGTKWIETKTTTKKITPEYYINTIDAVPFFRNLGGRERVVKAYTSHGLIPVEIHSTSPDGTEKTTRKFAF